MDAQLGLFNEPVARPNVAWGDARVEYFPDCVDPVDRGRFLSELMSTTPWDHDDIVMYGKKMKVPRLSSWHGDAGVVYSYSNIDLEAKPWTAALTELKTLVETRLGCTFNSVLANLYRDGSDSVAWHADDEPELGPEPLIASLSFGAERRFHLRHRTDAARRWSADLTDGSLLVMGGSLQRDWLHQVPKTTRSVGPRVNLTFRTVTVSSKKSP